ncbi:hypothetical protein BDY19DRAFT_931183 [Irpex rosettiformis]|uniref:Uncharacterized protein n=1 Tax=Irpex rosettiformis TaxID=378272 RepID=A0ACB8UBK3_9APHY|nr:hypothetical protein BDY19DRAFT_931183 [Irpex rosettiformis]
MQFPFSFVFSVPGMVNPFAPIHSSPAPRPSKAEEAMNGAGYVKVMAPSSLSSRSQLASVPSQSQSPSKKRGWMPAFSEPSEPVIIAASTSGYFDTPSKYKDLSGTPSRDEVEYDDMAADLPPPKRRKTLTGSIVSTALSAALIGTAVGLTVYRLWRGREKESEALPPPPYEQGGWVPPTPDQPEDSEFSDMHIVDRMNPRTRKQRLVTTRRTVPRQRKHISRVSIAHAIPDATASTSTSAHAQTSPQFNFNSPTIPEPVGKIEDQMDWMGTQLAKLIEEGKRALNKEVVVMSERQEDEEDDGMGQWVDESNASFSCSRSGSIRHHKRPRNSHIPSPPPSYASPQSSPRQKSRFSVTHSRRGSLATNEPQMVVRGVSSESARSYVDSHQQEDSSWQSPELRESMERARMLYLQQRNQSA